MKGKLLVLASTWVLQGFLLQAQDPNQLCIPQYIDGAAGPFRWETTLVLQNGGPGQAQVMLHFYDSDGQPMNGLTMGRRAGQGPHRPVVSDGRFNPGPINGGATRSYRSGGRGAVQAGYCLLESPDPIQIHARIHLFDGSGNLMSEAAILPHPKFRAGSFWFDRTDGQGTGMAFANTSPDQGASCTLEIFEEDGVTSLGSVDVEMGPRSQVSRLLDDLFPEILTDDAGFIRVSCDSPVCGLAMQLRGLNMLQVPIVVEVGEAP